VVAGLESQTLPVHEWELLIVDNASKESVAERLNISWHPNGRHVFEAKLGLTQARLRGVAEAKGELLVFVDDDNVLDSKYLEVADRIAEQFPHIGAFGGALVGEFEAPVPDWARPYLEGLCLKDLTRDRWSNDYAWSDAIPYGAGMCVRPAVAEEYAKKCNAQHLSAKLDRVGSRLTSAGDLDLAWTALDLGFGTGRFRDLRALHLIPKERLTEDYLVRLYAGYSYSNIILWYTRGLMKGKPENDWREKVRHLIAFIRMRGVRRRMYFASRSAAIEAWSVLEANGHHALSGESLS
jgi:glycosyltransferase involved in cell wall biosynthesis